MQILHFSDTHLGHQQYNRVNEQGLNQREADHYAAFDAIIEEALRIRPDVVIHAGDLFDGVRPSNRALHVALRGFLRLGEAGIETIIIAGNHEHPKLRGTGSPFSLLEHLPNVHAVFKGKAESFTIAGKTIHAIPQHHTPEALQATMDTRPQGDILVMHGGVHDLEAFHHAEFNEQSLDPRWFEGYEYVALGHYHGLQQVAENAWYCGAPDRVSMKESGEEKGFILWDNGNVSFQPLHGRPYKDLPIIDATGLDASTLHASVMDAAASIPSGSIARIRIENMDPSLRGSLPVKEWKKTNAIHTDLKLEWADENRQISGSVEFRGMDEEFSEFAAQFPIEDLDREKLLSLAKSTLQESA